MVDLLDIGRSGLMAYRSALAVTGENIANVDTQGYRRRDVVMQEIQGASASPVTKGSPGAGVSVTDIRRAFDGLLAERTRSAAGSLGMAETGLAHLSALEDRLMPGDGGIPDLLDGFFDSLDGLASAPSDTGLRQVALLAGRALAGGISDLAQGLNDLAQDVADERNIAIDQTNNTLKQLAQLQQEIIRIPNQEARNPVLDRRDAMLADLARMTDISVEIGDNDLATVRLGSDGNGALVLDRNRAGFLSAGDDTRLAVVSADPAAAESMRTPASGVLRGLSNAAGVIGQTVRDLDTWAAGIASEMNKVHAAALDAAGNPGGPLLTLTGMDAEAGATNRGNAALTVTVTNPDLLPDDGYDLVFDAPSGTWSATNAAGAQVGQGVDSIGLPGLQIITEGGAPQDGDRFHLSPRSGSAIDITFLPQNPDDLATAGAHIVTAAPSNAGNAKLSAAIATPVSSGKTDLASVLGAETVEFLSSGVVGVLPAKAASTALTAQGRDAAMDFVVSSGASLSGLRLELNGATHEFPLSGDLQAAADALNSGDTRDAAGNRLADLGLYAQLEEGALSVLAWAGNTLPTGEMTTSAGAVEGVVVADAVAAAEPRIFTRDGRQLSGTPLGAEEAATFLTAENGFHPSASYDASYLNAAAGFGAVTQSRAAVDGAATVLVNSDRNILGWTDLPVPSTPATSISFDAAGFSGDVTLPEGANAAWRADILAQALPVSVDAETRLSMTPPATGEISFRLAGDNANGVLIRADLSNGGPAALADAINAQSAETGIRAEVAPVSGRLTLTHDNGADVVLTSYSHSDGAQTDLRRLDPQGVPLGVAGALSPSVMNARITGTVTLTNPQSFGITEDGVFREAAFDAFQDGIVSRETSAAGSSVTLTPAAPTAGDTALRGIAVATPDGREIIATATPFTATTGGDIAAAMLSDLRAQAPASRLTGAAVPNIPADGAQMRVSLGDQIYTLRMQDGGVSVEGPEAGRITAAFGADGALVVETVGGQLNGEALRLASDPGEAARFGMGAADGVMTTVVGAPFDAGNLPATFTIAIGNTDHTVSVSSGAVMLPATFPGVGSVNTALGRIEITFDANSQEARIAAQSGAANAGFTTLDAAATLNDDSFTLTAADGRTLAIDARHQGQGATLYLDNLPEEELLVVMPEGGALRLAGDIDTATEVEERAKEVRVLDAASGSVGLFDIESGAFLAARVLDASGYADFGGLSVTIAGTPATGDRFGIAPNGGGTGDSTGIEALARLRQTDAQTGLGGYTAGFSRILTAAGAQVRAGEDRLLTSQNVMDSATRAEENASAVDLDAEAARLMQQQQAYQANAQVISVAKQLFDTLLNAL